MRFSLVQQTAAGSNPSFLLFLLFLLFLELQLIFHFYSRQSVRLDMTDANITTLTERAVYCVINLTSTRLTEIGCDTAGGLPVLSAS